MHFVHFCWLLIGAVWCGSDYYAVLGVARSASKKQIKKAYRDLSRKWHPDKNRSAGAKDRFIAIAQAYEVLLDHDKRARYDRHGEEGLGQQFHDPFDVFSQFGRQQRHTHERRGPALVLSLRVSLKDVFVGASIDIDLNKQTVCHVCSGSGAKSDSHVHVCSVCKGHGQVVKNVQIAPGFYTQAQQKCTACNGAGKVVKEKCPSCMGKKVKRGSSQISVDVERGMHEGTHIVFEGEADQSPDFQAGHVTFVIKVDKHPVFTRKDHNLYMTRTLTLREALLGFNHTIHDLAGKPINLNRSGVTPSGNLQLSIGFVHHLPNKGMPKDSFSDDMGDLFIEYQVIFPDLLSNEKRKLLESIFA